jgi:hypothetical protein
MTINLDDFFTGFLSILTLYGIEEFSVGKNFHSQIETIIKELEPLYPNVKLSFRIKTHPIHQDSLNIQEGLFAACQRGILINTTTAYKICMTEEMALSFLETLPKEYFRLLASKLLTLA